MEGGAASSVAGGQYPVLRWPSWCHGEAGIRLQSPSAAPPVSWTTVIVDHMGLTRGGDRTRLFFLFFDRPVQCDLLIVAESAVMHVISGCL